MLTEFGVTDKGEANTLKGVLEPVSLIIELLASEEPNFDLLRKVYNCLNSKALVDPDIMIKDVQKSWGSLPGDIFHLPSMPDGAVGHEGNGLFLMLRNIRQVEAVQVSARPDDIRSGHAVAKRVGRVTAPYRYAITQNLAKVFSDIGLPEDHEDRRKNAAHRLFQVKEAL